MLLALVLVGILLHPILGFVGGAAASVDAHLFRPRRVRNVFLILTIVGAAFLVLTTPVRTVLR